MILKLFNHNSYVLSTNNRLRHCELFVISFAEVWQKNIYRRKLNTAKEKNSTGVSAASACFPTMYGSKDEKRLNWRLRQNSSWWRRWQSTGQRQRWCGWMKTSPIKLQSKAKPPFCDAGNRNPGTFRLLSPCPCRAEVKGTQIWIDHTFRKKSHKLYV